MKILYTSYYSMYKAVVYDGYWYSNDLQAIIDYQFDTWYNIVVTFNGTMAAIYINGRLVFEQNKSAWNTLPGNFHFGATMITGCLGLTARLTIFVYTIESWIIMRSYRFIMK
jgi:hypothetical protein